MPAIKVEDLSKEYVLGGRPRTRETLRELLADALSAPYRRYRRLAGDTARAERFFALKDVSFEVEPGEVVGIIGRNGAGKSTLLKIISGITDPTAGRVELAGRTSSLLEVGTGFHPELTGRENIFLNGALLGMSRAETRRKFDEIVAFSEIEKFIDTPVKHYSSGMYVRLAFAVAAHLEPEILIVDEVLAVGDARFQQKCLGRIGEIGTEGRTVLVVSHNMQAIQALCGRALWLNDGRIAFDGSARSAVLAYSRIFSQEVVERTWSDPQGAPGNDAVRMQSARVVPEPGATGFPLTTETPFRIELAYRLLVPECMFHIGMHLRAVGGEIIFATTSSPAMVRGGEFRSSCRVPGDLLNNGKYTIDLFFGKDGNVVLCKVESPLVFDVHDAVRQPGSYLGEMPGAVRPKLRWATEPVQ